MGLSNALFSSVTGLDAASNAISVIGDNIANANTPGFKEKRAEFVDVLGQSITSGAGFSQIGSGARTIRIGQIFTQGTFETSSRPTDLGIQGQGFFILDDNTGRSFSRAGAFGFDAGGTMVDAMNSRVQGFGIDPVTQLDNGVLGDITLNTAISPPRASTTMQLSLNLDESETAIPGGWDPADPGGSSQFRTVVEVFDSLGGSHQVTYFFTKTAPNTWGFDVTLPAADTSVAPVNASDTFISQGSGALAFDANGNLLSSSISNVTLQFDPATTGATPSQVVGVNFGPIAGVGTGNSTTQFQKDSTVNSFSQDGFAAGSLTSLSIDADGFLNAGFDNGETVPIARLALANFGNIEGLRGVGNSRLNESRASGAPVIGVANAGNLGAIRSSSLEQSNVDLATQFVKMIVSQRAFQANTRTVSVTNELLANLVSLGA